MPRCASSIGTRGWCAQVRRSGCRFRRDRHEAVTRRSRLVRVPIDDLRASGRRLGAAEDLGRPGAGMLPSASKYFDQGLVRCPPESSPSWRRARARRRFSFRPSWKRVAPGQKKPRRGTPGFLNRTIKRKGKVTALSPSTRRDGRRFFARRCNPWPCPRLVLTHGSFGPPMTLGAATRAGVRLIVWCWDCGHQVEPDPRDHVAHQALRAKADGDADDAEPGEKRADVETEGRQRDDDRDDRERDQQTCCVPAAARCRAARPSRGSRPRRRVQQAAAFSRR